MEIDLTSAWAVSFTTTPTYSHLDIARRITEDYNIEHLTPPARSVKRIRPEQGWLRRHNDPAAAEMRKASTIDGTFLSLSAKTRILQLRSQPTLIIARRQPFAPAKSTKESVYLPILSC